jgi:hypothetical protein
MISVIAFVFCVLVFTSVFPSVALGQSTVSAQGRFAYAGNAGWIDALPSGTDGVRITDNVCSGYLYSANFGWIHLGSGSPANGIQYGNASATDYGVNVSTYAVPLAQAGQLRGYWQHQSSDWLRASHDRVSK